MLLTSVCALLLSLVGVCDSVGDPGGIKCEGVEGAPSCVCKTSNGTIDLTKIVSFNGTPR
jgi:hypothetical protein